MNLKETARKLIELAKGATPGPWKLHNTCHQVNFTFSMPVGHVVADFVNSVKKGRIAETQAKNGEYITACSPDVLTALMTRYLKMEEAMEFIRRDSKQLLENTEMGSHENATALRIFSASVSALSSDREALKEGTNG